VSSKRGRERRWCAIAHGRALSVSLAVALAAGALLGDPASAAARSVTPACDRIAHVGDSLTVQMQHLLPGGYARHGWDDVIVDAYGGRGVSRQMYADVTGLDVVRHIVAGGFSGCWVIALGTNDTAHVGDDGAPPEVQHQRRREIIASMMTLIGDAPVMWVDVFLVAADDAYSAAAAADWNLALVEEQQRHQRMAVFAWAPIAAAHPSWMAGDRIHDSRLGSIARARLVTDAAAARFATARDDTGAEVASLAPPLAGAATSAVAVTAPRAWLARR
jgi:hypothetical protein